LHVIVIAGLAIGCGSKCPEVVRCPEASPPSEVGRASGDPGATQPSTTASTEKVFTGIYDHATWGTNTSGKGNSGTGSTIDSTIVYTTYLQRFMKEHGIKSVIDAGCGDWEFSSTIDWTGIDYKGYDIVASVIADDTKKYGTPTIQFFVGNILDPKLPAADLLVSKDVLQHLPNADVKVFLEQLPKYKHVLLTNGTDWRTLTADNVDIALGDYRVLDLTRPPFGIAGKKVLTYDDGKHTHQVLHIARPDPSPAP
jgi:SAM-dependent methyltransferase